MITGHSQVPDLLYSHSLSFKLEQGHATRALEDTYAHSADCRSVLECQAEKFPKIEWGSGQAAGWAARLCWTHLWNLWSWDSQMRSCGGANMPHCTFDASVLAITGFLFFRGDNPLPS
ncbi:hypothetical protein WMY93_003134 [Mugilogobius chulae]|uniref:Uncharacterized protein n=1 Tax=Mugilogobius chulae TaxID=88201 RepID=A0AAW0PXE6_9GOBI